MALRFTPANHSYESTDGSDIPWISATSFISNFKQPFDGPKIAKKCAVNKKSKWYGMTEKEILTAWKSEADRATTLGTWYHNQRESDLCEFASIEIEGVMLPIFPPAVEAGGVKFAPKQELEEGIYPEHLMFLKSAGLCGQSDKVEVRGGYVNILDYKTNKEIKTEGFKNWEGKVTKMLPPVSHLDDCHLNHYALQLSLYMFMILKHNHLLKPGKLIVHHVTFHEVGKDKFGNPVTAVDPLTGDPIVKEVIPYDLPYLKNEVITLVNWLKDNRHKIKKH